MTYMIGLQADIIAANRKIIQDVQYHVRQIHYGNKESSVQEEENIWNGKYSRKEIIMINTIRKIK